MQTVRITFSSTRQPIFSRRGRETKTSFCVKLIANCKEVPCIQYNNNYPLCRWSFAIKVLVSELYCRFKYVLLIVVLQTGICIDRYSIL